ncbi:BAH and coiled-coil domain-containing protein 1-like isoform X2 [Corythoichthys intestinalis]|uniref:BAH and coiled-coil domain-containing protein 1-like isoform X2 n=1 Tax=Corythoichthys intestinalis TaxID=161448 RepID=UPI0025A68888|nr:BAH and coiled-coil domain-containing protein 1-like isoform X2 [Corythoichthys intestinalis]
MEHIQHHSFGQRNHDALIQDSPSARRRLWSSSASSFCVTEPFSRTLCPGRGRSPAGRNHPPDPLNGPAAAAPRSSALGLAPWLLPKGLERTTDLGEGRPPHDYPQALEPNADLSPVYTFPVPSEAGPSPEPNSKSRRPPPRIPPLAKNETEREAGDRGVLETHSEPPEDKESLEDPDHENCPFQSSLPDLTGDIQIPGPISKDDHKDEKMKREPTNCTSIERKEETTQHEEQETRAELQVSSYNCPSSNRQDAYASGVELLIAAARYATGDALQAPVPTCSSLAVHQGIEILGELAELEIHRRRVESKEKQDEGDRTVTFDLGRLATAQALEMHCDVGANKLFTMKRRLNLHRKCSWTPHHVSVCKVKCFLETMGEEELSLRVQLAKLQRRYKKKLRELAKLERKQQHYHHPNGERSGSPYRSRPVRPRKCKSSPSERAPDSAKRLREEETSDSSACRRSVLSRKCKSNHGPQRPNSAKRFREGEMSVSPVRRRPGRPRKRQSSPAPDSAKRISLLSKRWSRPGGPSPRLPP